MKSRTLNLKNIAWANAALAIVLCASLAKPIVSDLVAEQLPTESSSYVTSRSGFDFGSFMSLLDGFMKLFGDALTPFIEAPVSGVEKQNAIEKDLTQSALNYDASKQAVTAAAKAEDLFAPEPSSACDIKLSTLEAVDAKSNEPLMARAMTASNVRRSRYENNSSGSSRALLAGSHGDYCSPESLARGSCSAGLSPKNMPDADILSKTMMSTEDNMTKTFSQDEFDAASKYVIWATDPVPQEVLPISLEKTPAGQRFALEKRRREAIASAAQYSLNRIIASRWEKR